MKSATYERYKRIIREPMIAHKKKTFFTFSKRCDYEQNLVLEVDENDDAVKEDLKGIESTGEKAMKKIKKVEKNVEKLEKLMLKIVERHDEKLKQTLGVDFIHEKASKRSSKRDKKKSKRDGSSSPL